MKPSLSARFNPANTYVVHLNTRNSFTHTWHLKNQEKNINFKINLKD